MEITQQIRDFAQTQGLSVEQAVEVGLADKAEEFRTSQGKV
jgi:phosphomethylpyrimidine synthase